jgi:hypothetical protein
MMEDELERTLKGIREVRDSLIAQLSRGAIPVENVQGGYRELTGFIKGLDQAEEIIKEEFKGWMPPPLAPKPAVADRWKTGDY